MPKRKRVHVFFRKRKKNAKKFRLCDFPDELMAWIMSFLDCDEHFNVLPFVCKWFNATNKDPSAWPPIIVILEKCDLKIVPLLKPKRMKIYDPTLQNGDLKQLCGLPITDLNISGCLVTTPAFTHIASLPLTRLNLSSCIGVTDECIALIAELPLTDLDLGHCINITQTGFNHLKGVSLKQLNMRWCEIDDLGFLKGMPLVSLDLNYTEIHTWGWMRSLDGLPLEYLSVAEIHERDLIYLKHSPIRVLLLKEVDITAEGFQYLKGLPLVELEIGGEGESLQDEDFKHLETLPLRTFELSGYSGITGSGFKYLKALKKLSINECCGLDPTHLFGLRSLQKLDVFNCYSIHPKDIDDLRKQLLGCEVSSSYEMDLYGYDDY